MLQKENFITLFTVDQILKDFNIDHDQYIGNFLFGSQNHNLDYEGSDIDTIMIVRKMNKPWLQVQTQFGITKIYTFQYFIHKLSQGDLQCHEILFTEYQDVNPIYRHIWISFVDKYTKLMNCERIKFALRKKLIEHIEHITCMVFNKDRSRYNKKRLYQAIRVFTQLQRIIQGESFEDTLKYRPILNYNLIKIKSEVNYLSIKDFQYIYKYLIDFLHSLQHYSKEATEAEKEYFTKIGQIFA